MKPPIKIFIPNNFFWLHWLNLKLILLIGIVLWMVIISGSARQPSVAQAEPGVKPLSAGQTTVTITSITIPTHPVDSALTYYTNPTYNMPYAKLDRSKYDSGRIINRTFTLIVLENDYLKVSLLPGLGGRIYQAIFKPTGNDMFYQNPVLKPSPWGPTEMGWWLAAGGMEWGLPVEEHGYEWGIPWAYQITDQADGVMVEVWDSTATDRLRAKIAITLPDDAAFFQVSPTIENPTNQPIDYKFWLNAMLAPGPANRISPRLRIVMPTSEVTVHSTGDRRLPGAWAAAGWPIHNGVDWSLLGNWREWYGFFQRPRAAGDFQAIYDEGYDEGAVRTYDSRIVQGAKFFAFGNGSNAISPDLYTDDGSSYVEMHGGVAPTFADTRRLEAHTAINWQERWYPVAGLGSLTWANDRLALHLEDSADTTRLHLAVTRLTPNARILLLRRSNNEVLYDMRASLQPGQPFHSTALTLPNLTAAEMAVLVYDSSDALLGAYQYGGGSPFTPTPGPSPTPTLSPTPNPNPVWQGRLLRTIPIQGWSSIVRIWVRNKIGLPVTIASESGSWRATTTVGSKPEYGSDALEFAPLAPGVYIITPQGLNTSFRLNLLASTIAEVLFEPVSATTPSPSATPTSTSTLPAPATASPTSTPTFTPTPTRTPSATPTATPTPSPTTTPTPTSPSAWAGRIRRTIPIGGWSSIVRIWVSGQKQLPVTLAAVNWNWRATNYTGSKPEYGPDALEFAPLAPGRYLITVPGLNARFEFDLLSSTITEVVFEPTAVPTPTLSPTPTPSPTTPGTATPTLSPTPTPSPTSTATATPTFTATASPPPSPTLSATSTLSPVETATATPSATFTPSPSPTATFTPTATSIPTPTTPAATWHVRVPSNTTVPGNWFAVIRVSVEGLLRQSVRATIVSTDSNPFSMTCLTGAKPEYGPYYCEFAPLIPGRYTIAPEGLDISTTLDVGRGGVAVVIFERY